MTLTPEMITALRSEATAELHGPDKFLFAGVRRYAAEYVYWLAVRIGRIYAETDPKADQKNIRAIAEAT